MKCTRLLILAWYMSNSLIVYAQSDNVVSLETTVVGNQEQPKVLYIVPWQSATDTTILSLPVTSLTNDVFDHVDRDEHKREIQFIEELDAKE